MLTMLKVMCKRSLGKRITLPKKDWFVLTEYGALITYEIDGIIRFITFNEREELAELLYRKGKIESYQGNGKGLKMYEKKFGIDSKSGLPIQLTWIAELKYSKIKLLPFEVIEIASDYEFSILENPLLVSMGLAKARPYAKVINMSDNSIKLVA